MANISQIKTDSNWGDAASTLNSNFQNMNVDLEKVKSSTTKFKGYFTTETALKQAYPSPKVGDTAWVGSTYPGTVYDVHTDGIWHNTGTAPDTETVDLTDYAKKEELTELENKLDSLEVETDTELNDESQKPIANSVVAKKFKEVEDKLIPIYGDLEGEYIKGQYISSGDSIKSDDGYGMYKYDISQIKNIVDIYTPLTGNSYVKTYALYKYDSPVLFGPLTSKSNQESVDLSSYDANILYVSCRNSNTEVSVHVKTLGEKINDNTLYIENVEKSVEEKISDVITEKTLDEGEWISGYITPEGKYTVDGAWRVTDFIDISNMVSAEVSLIGQHNISMISYYSSNEQSTFINGTNITDVSEYKKKISREDIDKAKEQGAKYIRFGRKNSTEWSVILGLFNPPSTEGGKPTMDILSPRRIYSVYNDINLAKNNFLASIYLDHFFKPVLQELKIRFSNGLDRYGLKSISSSSSYSKSNIGVIISGEDIADTEFTLEQVTTKNSSTKSKKAHLFSIGDSVTKGQLSGIYATTDDYSYRYSALCEQMSVVDRIENGTYSEENNDADYVIRTIGHISLTKRFSYEGKEYSFVNSVYAGLGATTEQIFKNFINSDGSYSIEEYLKKYRTCDDNGDYLEGSAGETVMGKDGKQYTIGTLVSSITSTTYRCYYPTHVVIASGLNDSNDADSWYNLIYKIISDFKEEAQQLGKELFIGVMPPDTVGTIFPSLHPNCDEGCIEKKENNNSRREKMYSFVEKWMSEQNNEDENKNWLIPAYWCIPCGETVSYRPVFTPEYPIDNSNIYHVASGSYPQTHFNAIGHYNVAYQLYSWIKYTLALE